MRPVLILLRFCIAGLGVLVAYASRFTPRPDGTSYLDISDVYLSGEWPLSRSGYWSPLYPTLLALFRRVFGTEAEHAWVIGHLVNLAAFFAAIGALEFFVRTMRRVMREEQERQAASTFAWTVLAYAVFGWIVLRGEMLETLTPDLWVVALLFASAGLSVRVARLSGGLSAWWLLGAVLGLGYLAKAAVLPISVVVIATTIAVTSPHARWRGGLVAFATLAAVAGPQVWYVSILKGAPTTSDVARVNYAWFVARVPPPLWPYEGLDLPATLPTPRGGPQIVRAFDPDQDTRPPVYSFNDPEIPGSFPLWYDPTHWYRDVEVPFSVGRSMTTATYYAFWYVALLAPLLMAVIVWILVKARRGQELGRLSPAWEVVLPSVAGLVMYALVYCEIRYVAAYIVLLVAGLVPPWAGSALSRHVRAGCALGGVLVLAVTAGTSIRERRRELPRARALHDSLVATGRELAARVAPGTAIGLIGDPYFAYWLRFGGLRVVSVVPRREAPTFWQLDDETQRRVLSSMLDSGAEAIVAQAPPSQVASSAWEPLGSNDSLLLYLPVPGPIP